MYALDKNTDTRLVCFFCGSSDTRFLFSLNGGTDTRLVCFLGGGNDKHYLASTGY